MIFETATRGDDIEGGHVPARQGQEPNRDPAEDEGAHHQAPRTRGRETHRRAGEGNAAGGRAHAGTWGRPAAEQISAKLTI